jgi:hypothetical protein
LGKMEFSWKVFLREKLCVEWAAARSSLQPFGTFTFKIKF